MAKRGRPRKDSYGEYDHTSDTEMDDTMIENEDPDKTRYELGRKIAAEDAEHKRLASIVNETWYEVQNGVLVEFKKKANGNKYSLCVGRMKQKAVRDYADMLKKKGSLR